MDYKEKRIVVTLCSPSSTSGFVFTGTDKENKSNEKENFTSSLSPLKDSVMKIDHIWDRKFLFSQINLYFIHYY